MRRVKKNKINFLLFIIFIFSISIGYAFLSAMTSIFGTIDIKGNTWNLKLENIKVSSGSVVASTIPIACSIDSNLNAGFSLLNPGDYYEYTVDVVNDGTIDAYLDSFLLTPTLDSTTMNYINYTIEYENGEALVRGQLVPKNSFVRLKIRMEHRTDFTGTQKWFDNIETSLKLNYIPNKGTGVLVNNNGLKISVNGSVDDIGTIVTIGDQQFYTIGTEGDNLLLLGMYNLHVGNICFTGSESSCSSYGDEATGMQDSTMLGFISLNETRRGTVKYNSSVVYSSSLPAYYVDNYKTLLENKYDIEIVEAKIPGLIELEDLECDVFSYTCNNSPYSWIYSTSYWLKDYYDESNLYVMKKGVSGISIAKYDSLVFYGVRPVIVLPISEINGGPGMIQFSIDGEVYRADEGMTWAEWVDSEYNVDGFFVTSNVSEIELSGTGCVANINDWDTIVSNYEYSYSECTREEI